MRVSFRRNFNKQIISSNDKKLAVVVFTDILLF